MCLLEERTRRGRGRERGGEGGKEGGVERFMYSIYKGRRKGGKERSRMVNGYTYIHTYMYIHDELL